MAKTAKESVKFSCTIMWANLHTRNEKGKFPSNKYDFMCTNLSPAAVDALESVGLKVGINAKKPEQGHYIKCKSERPFVVRGEDGEVMEDATIVGNGTKAVVIVEPYQYNFKGTLGLSPSAKRIQITDLKEYVVEGEDTDDEPI